MNEGSHGAPVALVTGGCGFIGANFIHHWLRSERGLIVNLDLLTYAGNPQSLRGIDTDRRYEFVRGDIGDNVLTDALLAKHRPQYVVHFAAESHVDRSISGPEEFVTTNVVGTLRLLRSVLAYWQGLNATERGVFRFLHVSTDEVYGSLQPQQASSVEGAPYAPNSPYAASKAAADHFVRAWFRTYGLPTITSNCTNNYGPYQFPEKLIPLLISNALLQRPLPIYGDGQNVRDWLYVEDHCDALRMLLRAGIIGGTYNIGAGIEKTNLEVVESVCEVLQALRPAPCGKDYRELIAFVADRPGHDRRYSIDAGRIRHEIGWAPRESFESGLRKTVSWYLDNGEWLQNVRSGAYAEWIRRNYNERAAQ